MDKIITYINNKDTDTLAKEIAEKKKDNIFNTIDLLRESTSNYENKVEEVIRKVLQLTEGYYIGQVLTSKIEIPGKIKKGQKVVVTNVVDGEVVINASIKISIAQANLEYIRASLEEEEKHHKLYEE